MVPTVELHRHFEAGLPPETIARLAQKNGVTEVRTRQGEAVDGVDPQDPTSIRAYYERVAAGFKGPGGWVRFIDSFGLPLSVLQSLEDLEQAAFEQIVEQASQGSLHTEVRGSPFSYQERIDATLIEIIDAIRRGVERAWNERGASGTYIAAFSRQKGLGPASGPREARQAPEVAAAVAELHEPDRPVGIDVAGFPEVTYPPRLFREALAPVRESGAPITIHCGEQGTPPEFVDSPPELIIEAIEVLGAKRIGHGTSLVCSPDARALVRAQGVGIECCPGSNRIMGFVADPRQHPLKSFLDEGLLASIATDDPLMFGDFSVNALLAKYATALGLDAAAQIKLASNGIATAFVSEARRAALRERLAHTLA